MRLAVCGVWCTLVLIFASGASGVRAETIEDLTRQWEALEAANGDPREISATVDRLVSLHTAASDTGGALAVAERAASHMQEDSWGRDLLEQRWRQVGQLRWSLGQTDGAEAALRKAHSYMVPAPVPSETVEVLSKIFLEHGKLVEAEILKRETSSGGDVYAISHLQGLFRSGRKDDDAAIFALMQVPRSAAAQSLNQLIDRSLVRKDLRPLYREQQAILQDARRAWPTLSATAGGGEGNGENATSGRLASLNARLGVIKATLEAANRWPAEGNLAEAPLTVDDAKQLVKPTEALIQFMPAPKGPGQKDVFFAFVLTRDLIRFVRLETPATAVSDMIDKLRCDLDPDVWNSAACRLQDIPASSSGPASSAGPAANAGRRFDFATSFALYSALFGQIEPLIADKSLIVVASGNLARLPFHVLVTAAPNEATGTQAFREASWLVRRHSISVLPHVSALKIRSPNRRTNLRQNQRLQQPKRSYVGFANPMLLGGPGDESKAQIAALYDSCASDVAQFLGSGALATSVLKAELTAAPSGLAPLDELRRLDPVPGTGRLVCDLGKTFGVGDDDVYLAARATEQNLKSLSSSDQLASYKIINFATHSLVTGTSEGLGPGLVLTPPATASEEDDGYLSMNEASDLVIDADWVVLSACNTAAGNTKDAEALSGLANAFLFAGARALLVSHWTVFADSTVELVRRIFQRIAADETLGRAEAHRRAMLDMIENGDPRHAHPAHWAPFVVIGL